LGLDGEKVFSPEELAAQPKVVTPLTVELLKRVTLGLCLTRFFPAKIEHLKVHAVDN